MKYFFTEDEVLVVLLDVVQAEVEEERVVAAVVDAHRQSVVESSHLVLPAVLGVWFCPVLVP